MKSNSIQKQLHVGLVTWPRIIRKVKIWGLVCLMFLILGMPYVRLSTTTQDGFVSTVYLGCGPTQYYNVEATSTKPRPLFILVPVYKLWKHPRPTEKP